MAGVEEASSTKDTVLSAAVDCELTVMLMAGPGVRYGDIGEFRAVVDAYHDFDGFGLVISD